MSGIEVAGLILGAFPIAITLLEKYCDVAGRVNSWYKIRSEYQRCSHHLEFHRLSFEQNLAQLLFPLVVENRLQKSYGLYLEILNEMQQTMQELNKELSVDNAQLQSNIRDERNHHPPSQPSVASRFRKSLSQSNLEYQFFRLKFSLGERTRTRLFSEIQTCNDRLGKLILASDSMSDLRAGRWTSTSELATSAMSATLCKFWNHADRLYKALMGAWGCACREQHCAELILQHRRPQDNDFLLHLSSGKQKVGSVKTGSWSRCSVRLQMHEPKPTKTSSLLLPAESSGGVRISLSMPKNTQIFPYGSTYSAGSQSNTITLAVPPKPQQTGPTDNIADNLCKMLCNAIAPQSFIKCHDNIRYHLSPEKHPETHSNVCLSKILSGEVKPLTRLQRYRLSMTIASSFVQLKDTPWLRTPWGKDGVYFSLTNNQNTLLVDFPFIVQPFTSESLNTTPNAGHDVASIELLGIVLLELCFGTSIDRHPNRLKYPNGDKQARAAFDLVTALEWLKDVNEEAGGDYFEAVQWCLVGCRTLPSNGSWRKLMVERVVLPLERCYHYLST